VPGAAAHLHLKRQTQKKMVRFCSPSKSDNFNI